VHTDELMMVEFGFDKGGVGRTAFASACPGKLCRRRPLRGHHRRPDRNNEDRRQLLIVRPIWLPRRQGAGGRASGRQLTPYHRADFLA